MVGRLLFLLRWPIFKGHVSFREGSIPKIRPLVFEILIGRSAQNTTPRTLTTKQPLAYYIYSTIVAMYLQEYAGDHVVKYPAACGWCISMEDNMNGIIFH